MKIYAIPVEKPLTVIMIFLSLILFGAVSIFIVKAAVLPEIAPDTISVITKYDGASPIDIEQFLPIPIEEALSGISGLRDMYSESIEGGSIIQLSFDRAVNLNSAMLTVRENLSRVIDILPEDSARPIAAKYNPSEKPTVKITVSGKSSIDEIYNTVKNKIKPRYERINNAGSVKVSGGRDRNIFIKVKQDKLRAFNIDINEINYQLEKNSKSIPLGIYKQNGKEYSIKMESLTSSIEKLKEFPINLKKNTIPLKELAVIEYGYEESSSISKLDDQDCVIVSVSKESGSNTVDLSRSIKDETSILERDYPELKFTIISDASEVIMKSLYDLIYSAIAGSLSAGLVIFLFTGNRSASLIITMLIPSSAIISILIFHLTGTTFNIMSLGGIALSSGMLVDNGIVIIEYIHSGKKSLTLKTAIVEAISLTAIPLFASTLTTLVVFLPLFFIEGSIRPWIADLSISVCAGIIISYLLSITVLPSVLFIINRNKLIDDVFKKSGSGNDKTCLYVKYLSGLFEKKIVVYTIIIMLMSGTIVFFGLEKISLPEEKSESYYINVTYKNQLSDKSKSYAIERINTYVRKVLPVKWSLVNISSGNAGLDYYLENNSIVSGGHIQICLNTKTYPDEVRKAISGFKDELTDIEVQEDNVFNSILKSGIFSNIYLSFNELTDIAVAQEIIKKKNVPLEIMDNTLNDELVIEYQKDKVNRIGLNPYMISTAVKNSLAGNIINYNYSEGQGIPVKLKLHEKINPLESLVAFGDNKQIHAGLVASFIKKKNMMKIERNNRRRIVRSAVTDDSIENAVRNAEISFSGISVKPIIPSDYMDLLKSLKSFRIVIAISVLFVFFVLASIFESFAIPLLLITVIPMTIGGNMLVMFMMNKPFSIMSALGTLMLSGVIINNTIVMVDSFLRGNGVGSLKKSIVTIASKRFIPVCLTSISTAVSIIPFLLLPSVSNMQKDLSSSIFCGVVISTVVNLFLIPIIYMRYCKIFCRDDKSLREES